ncbi:MAG: hypothetical protein ONB16_04395 [candidate division KSB1 bacterium]|nr:hypothetical protein [candidate division KSB1 bacterium]MDZ7342721.1 hypothetical protein [candidate division KSB1 bacterium]
MLVNSFWGRREYFQVVKRVEKTDRGELYNKQIKVLEISAIISLLLLILLFQIFPILRKKTDSATKQFAAIEVINIPLIRNEEPPPPPPEVEEEIVRYTVIEEKEEPFDPRKLRELEKVDLDLNLKPEESLLASSQIGDISYAGFSRPVARAQRGVSLDISSDLSISVDRGSGVELGNVENQVRKKLVDSSPSLESPPIASRPTIGESPAKEDAAELIPVKANQFLLKESESMIGTDEYRLWNKINAALDRVDKNRYGKLPSNIQRTANGLAVVFNYEIGITHEIFWSKGGKVVIRVTGNRPRSTRDELERAFDSLIRLTL